MQKTNRKLLFILLIVAAGLSALILTEWNFLDYKVVKKVSMTGINFANRTPDTSLSSLKEFSESGSPVAKELSISFDMCYDALWNHNNLFQTAPFNSGVRMELSEKEPASIYLIVGESKSSAGFRSFKLADGVLSSGWHSVSVNIDRTNRVRGYFDGKKAIDARDKNLSYLISEIAVGTGFSKSRRFDGSISNFNLEYLYLREVFPPWLFYLVCGVFIFSTATIIIVMRTEIRLFMQKLSLWTAQLPGHFPSLIKRFSSFNYFEIIKHKTLSINNKILSAMQSEGKNIGKWLIFLNVAFIVLMFFYLSERTKYLDNKPLEFSNITYDSASRKADAPIFDFNRKADARLSSLDISCEVTPYKILPGSVLFQLGSKGKEMEVEIGSAHNPKGLFLKFDAGKSYCLLDNLTPNTAFLLRIRKTNRDLLGRKGKLEVQINNRTLFRIKADSEVDASRLVIGSGKAGENTFYGRIKEFSLGTCPNPKPISSEHLFMVLMVLVIIGLFLAVSFPFAVKTGLSFASFFPVSTIAALLIFSIIKIIKDPFFIKSIAPQTFVYIGALIFLTGLLIFLFDKSFKKGFLAALIIPFLIIILSGKILAFFGLIVFFAASLGAGFWLYDFFDDLKEPDTTKIAFSLFLGLGANCYLIWIMTHFKINYAAVYWGFFALQLLVFSSALLENLGNAGKKLIKYSFSSAQKLLIILMAVQVVYSLVPTYLWDDIVAHLYIPKVILLKGFFPYNPHYTSSFFNDTIMVIGAHSALFIMAGEFAIRLFYLAALFAALFLVEGYTRKRFGSRVSFLATAALALTPYFLWDLGCLHTDLFCLFSTCIVLVSFFSAVDNLSKKNIMLYFVFVALGLLTKLLNIFLIFPATLLLLAAIINKSARDKNNSLRDFISGCSISALLFAPLFIRNWVITKNPMFPLYNDIFKSPYYSATKPLPGFFKFTNVGLSWNSLYDITFEADKYYVGNHGQFVFGITYFVLFMFTFILFLYKREKRRDILTISVLFLGAVFLCYLITGPVLRYFIISAPIGAVLLAFIMNKLLEINLGRKVRYYSLCALFAVVFAINFVCQINIGYLPSPYPIIAAVTHKYETLTNVGYNQKVKGFFDVLNKKYGRNHKALLFYSPALYFADFDIETLDWYNQLTGMEIDGWKTIDEAYDRVFKMQKFDLLILTDNHPGVFLDEFVAKGWVHKEYSAAGYTLYLPVKKKQLS